jgi:hypothetical protein
MPVNAIDVDIECAIDKPPGVASFEIGLRYLRPFFIPVQELFGLFGPEIIRIVQ